MDRALNWEDRYWGSEYQIERRAKLRRVARLIAKRTGRDQEDVLRGLVIESLRVRLATCPDAIPTAVECEMRIHVGDELRELVPDVLRILNSEP